MTTALLKQMGVKRIICRVLSPVQKIVLEAMGIEGFVYPEAYSAERLALKLDLPGVVDSFQINPDYRLLEVGVPEGCTGSSILELDLAKRYQLVLVSILKRVSKKNFFGKTLTGNAVNEVDEAVEPLIKLITQNNKIPVVVGGGHNNAYPLLKGAAKGLYKSEKIPLASLNCINLDARADFRLLEGRHNANAFSYAEEDGLPAEILHNRSS